jgi:glycerol-3-phosphate dehydrogenase (NAD(P)+)
MKICVIGAGRWGSFLAFYLAGLGHSVCIYGRTGSASFEQLRRERKNEYVTLSPEVTFSSNLGEALTKAETVVISVGTQALAPLAEEIRSTLGGHGGKEYLLCMKGIATADGRRLSEILTDALGKDTRFAEWVGPGHAEDFVRGIPNCMLMVSPDRDYAKALSVRYASPLIRFYHSADLVGCEVGAATKNVIGIAAGLLDGMGYSSLKGALMARGPREIARLAVAMGGDERSIFGLCHLGDYEATLFSPHSHNRAFGEAFIRGEDYGKLAEGFYTVKALMLLKERYGVDMPICTAVYRIVHEHADLKEEMEALFLREQKREF